MNNEEEARCSKHELYERALYKLAFLYVSQILEQEAIFESPEIYSSKLGVPIKMKIDQLKDQIIQSIVKNVMKDAAMALEIENALEYDNAAK